MCMRAHTHTAHQWSTSSDSTPSLQGTTYQKTDAAVEMKRLNREQFWEQAKVGDRRGSLEAGQAQRAQRPCSPCPPACQVLHCCGVAWAGAGISSSPSVSCRKRRSCVKRRRGRKPWTSGCALSKSAWSKRGRSRRSGRSATGSERSRLRSTGKEQFGAWGSAGTKGRCGGAVLKLTDSDSGRNPELS